MDIKKERILSIDALRGFDMFWIIGIDMLAFRMYDASPSSFSLFFKTQMDHVAWTGFHFYDIIMPLFLFIVGAAMPYSISKRIEKGDSKITLYRHILKRFVILWILGMLVQGNLLSYDIEKIKLYSNTLQAIAAGYLIASICMLHLKRKGQIIATVLLLLTYYFCMALIPIPGKGVGIYTPDINLSIFIDQMIFGKMQDGTTYSWVLSSLNFGVTTLLGVFAGYLLQQEIPQNKKLRRLLIYGLSLLLISFLWHPFHPIVKRIWTSSFALFSGGICVLMLAAFYYVVDIKKQVRWFQPFIVIGSNAILAYLASHLFDWRLMADVVVGGLAQWTGVWQEVIRTAGGIMILIAILYFLYKQKLFLKI